MFEWLGYKYLLSVKYVLGLGTIKGFGIIGRKFSFIIKSFEVR